MSRKKENRNQDTQLKKIVLITAILQLVKSIIDLIERLIE